MSLNCVPIVAELRQIKAGLQVSQGIARYRIYLFNAIFEKLGVARYRSFFRFLYHYVAGRLESFQCRAQKCDILSRSAIACDSKTGIKRINAIPCDTTGVACFWSNEPQIPMLLRDRSSLFTFCDTFQDFLAQKIKKNKNNLFRYRSLQAALFQTQLRQFLFLLSVPIFLIYKGIMPNRKNKSRNLNTYSKPKLIKQEATFPYSRYKIDWCDIVTEGGWGSDKEFKNMKLATPVSEGYLFSKDKHTVKIFAGYDIDDDGTITFSERSVFPTSCVLKMTKLH